MFVDPTNDDVYVMRRGREPQAFIDNEYRSVLSFPVAILVIMLSFFTCCCCH